MSKTAMRKPLLILFLLFSIFPGAVPAQRKGAVLEQGKQLGKARFEPGDTARGGQGQPVDGIEGSSHEMLKTHFHSHLALFYRGKQVAIPYGIGIVMPFRVENGFVGGGQGFYWLHTHDASGIIHVESPSERAYTLGNFFDVWGEPLEAGKGAKPGNVAGLRGRLRVYVDGRPFGEDPRGIVLKPHEQITLVVGEPDVAPPTYAFPEGL
jgi:hypothetical protein